MQWLREFLAKGPVEREVVFESGEKAGYSRAVLYAAKDQDPDIGVMPRDRVCWWFLFSAGIPIPSNGVDSSRAIDAQERSKIIREDREIHQQAEEAMTEDQIIWEIRQNAKDGWGIADCFEDVWKAVEQRPNPIAPITKDRVAELVAEYFQPPTPPAPPTQEETELAEEFQRVSKLSPEGIQAYIKALYSKSRRAPNTGEIAEHRAHEQKVQQDQIKRLRAEIARLEYVKFETPDEKSEAVERFQKQIAVVEAAQPTMPNAISTLTAAETAHLNKVRTLLQ
jgi:hypothetical protein